MLWIVDGNNVMGSRPDGWWNDRAGAAARLANQVAAWANHQLDPVRLVFDGKPVASVTLLAGGPLAIEYAPGGRNAADDRIVELVEELYVDPDLVVVSADRGLIARLPPGVGVEGPGSFLARLDPGLSRARSGHPGRGGPGPDSRGRSGRRRR